MTLVTTTTVRHDAHRQTVEDTEALPATARAEGILLKNEGLSKLQAVAPAPWAVMATDQDAVNDGEVGSALQRCYPH